VSILHEIPLLSNDLQASKRALAADLACVASRDRWGLALVAVGWVHLGFFLVCQWLYSYGNRSSIFFLCLWSLEFATVVFTLRRIAGRGWFRSTPLAGVVMRVWATFLILSFNAASLNTLTGFTIDWFKLVWTTLSTFGFASMAHLLTPWFFLPAAQMYFTGLLIAWNPEWGYLIYGFSWWIAMQGIGVTLERKRARAWTQSCGEQTHSDTLSRPTVRLGAYESLRSTRTLINTSGRHPQAPGRSHSRSRGRSPAPKFESDSASIHST